MPHDNAAQEYFRCRAFPWEHLTLTGTNMLILLLYRPQQLSLAVRFFWARQQNMCCHLVFYTLAFKRVLVYERTNGFTALSHV